jgi:hypothetical protein
MTLPPFPLPGKPLSVSYERVTCDIRETSHHEKPIKVVRILVMLSAEHPLRPPKRPRAAEPCSLVKLLFCEVGTKSTPANEIELE